MILQTATPNSLLIIDEIGRGTSTFDGFGIAYAMSEYIITQINCATLFATHFHELTLLEKSHKNVSNKHVSAVVEKNELVMLYNVQAGPCSQSFGVHVATAAGFPKSVIAEAKRKAFLLDNSSSDSTENLDESLSKRTKIIETMTAFVSLPVDSIPSTHLKDTLLAQLPGLAIDTV